MFFFRGAEGGQRQKQGGRRGRKRKTSKLLVLALSLAAQEEGRVGPGHGVGGVRGVPREEWAGCQNCWYIRSVLLQRREEEDGAGRAKYPDLKTLGDTQNMSSP